MRTRAAWQWASGGCMGLHGSGLLVGAWACMTVGFWCVFCCMCAFGRMASTWVHGALGSLSAAVLYTHCVTSLPVSSFYPAGSAQPALPTVALACARLMACVQTCQLRRWRPWARLWRDTTWADDNHHMGNHMGQAMEGHHMG